MPKSKRLLLFLSLLLLPAAAYAGEYGVTLGDPWLGVKYDFVPAFGLEFRTTFDPEVKVNSLRGNWYFSRPGAFRLFTGLEYGLINFNAEGISGTGSVLTPSFGSEYAFHDKFAVAADLGYSYISLKSDNTSLSGPEITFNVWFILYPFAGPKEVQKPEARIEKPVTSTAYTQKSVPKAKTTKKIIKSK